MVEILGIQRHHVARISGRTAIRQKPRPAAIHQIISELVELYSVIRIAGSDWPIIQVFLEHWPAPGCSRLSSYLSRCCSESIKNQDLLRAAPGRCHGE